MPLPWDLRGRVEVCAWPSGPGGWPEPRCGGGRERGGITPGAGCRKTSAELTTAPCPGIPEGSASHWAAPEGRPGTLCPLA